MISTEWTDAERLKAVALYAQRINRRLLNLQLLPDIRKNAEKIVAIATLPAEHLNERAEDFTDLNGGK